MSSGPCLSIVSSCSSDNTPFYGEMGGQVGDKGVLVSEDESLGFIYLCPDNVACHWMYLVGALLVLSLAYVLFKKKYYHLHEEYLASLKK